MMSIPARRPLLTLSIAPVAGLFALTACAGGTPPEFTEIVDPLAESMRNQESVTYSETMVILSDPTAALWEEGMDIPEDGREISTEIRAIIGDTAHLRVDMGTHVDELVAHEGRVLLSGDGLAEFEQQASDSGFMDTAAFADDAHGLWFEMTEEFVSDPATFVTYDQAIDSIFEVMRGTRLQNASFSTSTDTFAGHEAWFYTLGDEAEIVISADESDPLLLHFVAKDADGTSVDIRFSDWNSTEVPEVPAEDLIYTSDELDEIYEEHSY